MMSQLAAPGAQNPMSSNSPHAGARLRDYATGATLLASVRDGRVAIPSWRAWGENDEFAWLHRLASISSSQVDCLCVPVPKRAMTSEQQDEFRHMLKRHVKAN